MLRYWWWHTVVLSTMLVAIGSGVAGAQGMERVSVSGTGAGANGSADSPSISADGRYVAFHSYATNLVEDDTNGFYDVFVHDRDTRETSLVSVSSSGALGNDSSWEPSISPDGRYVAFSSLATNLVPGDTFGHEDIFLHDRKLATTIRVSVSSTGAEANSSCRDPVVSEGGRFVAYRSRASNLVIVKPAYTHWGIFLHDCDTRQTERVSVNSDGVSATNTCHSPSISNDGRYVAFSSVSKGFFPGEDTWDSDVLVRDRAAGYTHFLSQAGAGVKGNGNSANPSISGNGKLVVFESEASNLAPGDINGASDIYLHRLKYGSNERLSWTSENGEPNHDSTNAAISNDGLCVTWRSCASNIVPDDDNGRWDIFARAIGASAGPTRRLSVAADGTQATFDCWLPCVSNSGLFVAFHTAAPLVPSDSNAKFDVYLARNADATDSVPVLKWAGQAGWETDGVKPNTGHPRGHADETAFRFKVKYLDPVRGDTPLKALCRVERLLNDGKWAGVAKMAMAPGSGSFEEGKFYAASTTLVNGTYRHRFVFRDNDGWAVGDPSRWQEGPDITGPPKLCWARKSGYESDGVSPDSGPAGSRFTFKVRYTDGAGDVPSTHAVEITRNGRLIDTLSMTPAATGDYREGIIYRRSRKVSKSGTYEYRFVFRDAHGEATGAPSKWTAGPAIEDGGSVVLVTALSALPTAAGAEVRFTLSDAGSVTGTVMNVAGRPVRTIAADRPMEAGTNTLLWDRSNSEGLEAPAGIYLVKVEAKSEGGGRACGLATLRVR